MEGTALVKCFVKSNFTKQNQPWFDARDSKDFVYRTPMGLLIISLDPWLLLLRSYKTGIIFVGTVKLLFQQEL